MGVEFSVNWLRENVSVRFEILYKDLYRKLYTYARNFLMDEELAEDIVQELFLNLFLKLDTLKNDMDLRPYLMTSLKNLCTDYHRKLGVIQRYQEHVLEHEELTVEVSIEDDISDREVRLRNIYTELPAMQKKVLELTLIEGLKYKEVAQKLHISEGTVHTHVKRAYKFIKDKFALFYIVYLCVIFLTILDEINKKLVPINSNEHVIDIENIN